MQEVVTILLSFWSAGCRKLNLLHVLINLKLNVLFFKSTDGTGSKKIPRYSTALLPTYVYVLPHFLQYLVWKASGKGSVDAI